MFREGTLRIQNACPGGCRLIGRELLRNTRCRRGDWRPVILRDGDEPVENPPIPDWGIMVGRSIFFVKKSRYECCGAIFVLGVLRIQISYVTAWEPECKWSWETTIHRYRQLEYWYKTITLKWRIVALLLPFWPLLEKGKSYTWAVLLVLWGLLS